MALYKERTLEIFETAPDFLLHIKGIGQERLKRIRQSWQEQKEVRKITKLVEIDQKIVEEAVQFGVEAKTVVREDVDGEPWLYLIALHRAEVGIGPIGSLDRTFNRIVLTSKPLMADEQQRNAYGVNKPWPPRQ